MCMCPWKPKGDLRSSGARDTAVVRYWELNLGPLQEQQMLSTVEASLQLLPLCLNPPFIALETSGNLHPIPGICTVKETGVSPSRTESYQVTGAPKKELCMALYLNGKLYKGDWLILHINCYYFFTKGERMKVETAHSFPGHQNRIIT